jgi:branched-chain amino acid transport system permease protein
MLDLVNSLLLGLALGSLYALLGVSFSLIFTPTGVFHLAHGAVFAVAAYVVYGLTVEGGLPWVVSLAAAVIVAGALGALMEIALYRPLRRRNASHLIVFIASASLLGLIQALVSIKFGTGHVGLGIEVRPLVDEVSFTNAQLGTVLLAWVVILPLALVVKRSVWGTTVRAVGGSVEAARRRGINVSRVYVVSFVVGSAILAPAAFLQAWSVGLTPAVGMHVALISTAITLIAGGRGIIGTALVGVGLGMVEALSLLVFPSGWQEGVTFFVLFLVVVTTGLLQHRQLGLLR